ncbi:MAG: hypothetical protein Q7N87_01505 [Candidatus Uhrbacteria bacterium]|nr:hypothetical protein [Candidatus Uhrbacteria bacterium]MDP3793531.1 hypothetical protein [Candidatus Uhrbacteria bacterium]
MIKIIGLLFIVGSGLIAIIAISVSVIEHGRRDVAVDLASACPKTYENDLLVFQYPCAWLLTKNDASLVFTRFNYNNKGGSAQKLYLDIKTPAEDDSNAVVGDRLLECESGDYFSRRKLMIPSVDGQQYEACLHGEHGYQSLTIRSDRSQFKYVSLSSDDGLLNLIIPSLKVK